MMEWLELPLIVLAVAGGNFLANWTMHWLKGKFGSGKPKEPEHRPEGNNFSTTELRGPYLEPYEMHSQYRPDSYGQISLKWHPPVEKKVTK